MQSFFNYCFLFCLKRLLNILEGSSRTGKIVHETVPWMCKISQTAAVNSMQLIQTNNIRFQYFPWERFSAIFVSIFQQSLFPKTGPPEESRSFILEILYSDYIIPALSYCGMYEVVSAFIIRGFWWSWKISRFFLNKSDGCQHKGLFIMIQVAWKQWHRKLKIKD